MTDFKGCLVALVTPFKDDGNVDIETLGNLLKFHVDEGTHGIVLCGSTGESSTLAWDEKLQVYQEATERIKQQIPVIGCIGTNVTEAALEMVSDLDGLDLDGIMVTNPSYNKPTQEGLYQHFKRIAENTHKPIIIYNIPSRTGVNMLPATVKRLSEISNIVAIKEASGDITLTMEIKHLCGNDISVLSGDDLLALPIMSVGGDGVISVVANIVPEMMNDLVETFFTEDIRKASQIAIDMVRLCKAMFIESNPIPVKAAMKMMGMIPNDSLRLPLTTMTDENRSLMREILTGYNLI